MTVVEALTQNPPAWKGAEQEEMELPETLPEPFFDIASHCLRRDPQRRWTVAEIGARLQQVSPALPGQQKVKGRFTKWGYLFSFIAAGLLLAMLVPRLLRHLAEGPVSPVAVDSSARQPAPQPGTGSGQAAQISPGKNQPSSRSNASRAAGHSGPRKDSVQSDSSGARAQGEVVQQILPDVSRNALRTIHGKLKVRAKVAVDSSGKVTVANFDSRGPSRYFAERVLRAAKQWTFKPPQVDGQSVPSEWILRFDFEKTGVSVHPAQTFP
jgi:TonB family protein